MTSLYITQPKMYLIHIETLLCNIFPLIFVHSFLFEDSQCFLFHIIFGRAIPHCFHLIFQLHQILIQFLNFFINRIATKIKVYAGPLPFTHRESRLATQSFRFGAGVLFFDPNSRFILNE